MNFISQITPKLLKQIDQYLLLNAPLVWRTKIHYLLFSFFFGNAAIVGLVYAYPISKQSFPSIDSMLGIANVFLVLLSFLTLYWGYTQFKFKLKSVGYYTQLLTFSLYLLGASIIVSHFAVLNLSLLHRVANVETTEIFQKEYDYLSHYGYIGFLDYHGGTRPSLNDKSTAIFAAYGYEAAYFETHKEDYYLQEIENAFQSLSSAKKFWTPRGSDYCYSYFRSFAVLGLLGFLLLPGTFLLVSYASPKELFLVAFIHFLTACACAFSADMRYIDVDMFYVMVCVALLGISLLMTRNNNWTRLVFFVLLIALPGTAWVTTMEHTSVLRAKLLHEGGIGYGLIIVAMLLSVLFAGLMAKRLSKPK